MKIKGFIITGIILLLLGISITAIASTRIDFDEGYYGGFSDPTLEERVQTFGSISKIHYDGSNENIEIRYDEGENTFTYYEGEKLTYEISYNEELKELSIQQEHHHSFFNFFFGLSKKAILTINSDLEEVRIDSGAGNVVIKDLTISTAKIDVNAANLKIENCKINRLEAESDAGNVNLFNLEVNESKLDARAGNLKIENSKFSNSTIGANAGNVNIKDTTFDTLDAKLNAGNLTFYGDILTRGEFKLDAGNLKLHLGRTRDFYKVNGEGSGDTILLYKVTAGNQKIWYAE